MEEPCSTIHSTAPSTTLFTIRPLTHLPMYKTWLTVAGIPPQQFSGTAGCSHFRAWTKTGIPTPLLSFIRSEQDGVQHSRPAGRPLCTRACTYCPAEKCSIPDQRHNPECSIRARSPGPTSPLLDIAARV